MNTAISVMGSGLVDGFGMKLTRLGGLQPFGVFRDLCAARGLPHTCDDSWGGDLVAAACIHMGSTVRPKALEGVWVATPYIQSTYAQRPPIQIDAGHLTVPQAPGLGVIPDEAKLGAAIASF